MAAGFGALLLVLRGVAPAGAVCSGAFGGALAVFALGDLRSGLAPPNVVLLATGVACLAVSPLWPGHEPLPMLLSAGAVLGPLALLYLVAPAVGEGDIKVAAVAAMGAPSVMGVALFVLVTLLTGELAALVLRWLGRRERGAPVRLLPAIAVGALAAMSLT